MSDILACPNCHSKNRVPDRERLDQAICALCGYSLIVRCPKCGRTIPEARNKNLWCGCGWVSTHYPEDAERIRAERKAPPRLSF